MQITDKLVSDLEKLARIELSDGEREKCREDMQNIVSYMDILDELDSDDMEPQIQSFSVSGAMRDDEVLLSAQRDAVLKNAPRSKNRYFDVPKTVE